MLAGRPCTPVIGGSHEPHVVRRHRRGRCFVRSRGAVLRRQKISSAHGLTAIQLECFKQQGAFYDAETKRWKMTGTDNNMLSRMEAVTNCVMQKTGKRPEPFLREERIYH